MTLQEVIKSGRLFKRSHWSGYARVSTDGAKKLIWSNLVEVPLHADDIIATDWEVKEETTEEQLKQAELRKAMDTVVKTIREDEDYRRSWRDNISMAFQDEYAPESNLSDNERANVREIANRAADRFLDVLTRDFDNGTA